MLLNPSSVWLAATPLFPIPVTKFLTKIFGSSRNSGNVISSTEKFARELAPEVTLCYYRPAVWKADRCRSRGLLFTRAHRQGGGQGSEIGGSATLLKSVVLGKQKVQPLVAVANLGQRALLAVLPKSAKKCQKVQVDQ